MIYFANNPKYRFDLVVIIKYLIWKYIGYSGALYSAHDRRFDKVFKGSVVCRTHRCILLEFQMALETLVKWPFVFQWVIQFCDQLDNLLIFPSEIGPCHYLAVLQDDDFLKVFFPPQCSPMVLDFREYCLRQPVFFFLHFEICFNDTVSDLAASSSGCRLQLSKHPLKAPLCKNWDCAILLP